MLGDILCHGYDACHVMVMMAKSSFSYDMATLNYSILYVSQGDLPDHLFI